MDKHNYMRVVNKEEFEAGGDAVIASCYQSLIADIPKEDLVSMSEIRMVIKPVPMYKWGEQMGKCVEIRCYLMVEEKIDG